MKSRVKTGIYLYKHSFVKPKYKIGLGRPMLRKN
jgi:hypothetical protein